MTAIPAIPQLEEPQASDTLTKRQKDLVAKYMDTLDGANPSVESIIEWDKNNGRHLFDWDKERNQMRGLQMQARSLLTRYSMIMLSRDSRNKPVPTPTIRFKNGVAIPKLDDVTGERRRLSMLIEHSLIRMKEQFNIENVEEVSSIGMEAFSEANESFKVRYQ